MIDSGGFRDDTRTINNTEELEAYFKATLGDFGKELEGKLVFFFEYEDSTPIGALMENGDIFKNVVHKIINKH